MVVGKEHPVDNMWPGVSWVDQVVSAESTQLAMTPAPGTMLAAVMVLVLVMASPETVWNT